MHEVMEAHEAAEHHEDNPFMLPVAVTLSILAVLVAIATLLGASRGDGGVSSAK